MTVVLPSPLRVQKEATTKQVHLSKRKDPF